MRIRLLLALAGIGVIAVAAFFGVRALVGGTSGPDVAAFFRAATPRPCAGARLTLSVSNASFAASRNGSAPASGGKFLIVDLAATGTADRERALVPQDFSLLDVEGRRYSLDPVSDAVWTPAPDATASSGAVLAFGVPRDLGAAKLVYDDGCARQEWVVP